MNNSREKFEAWYQTQFSEIVDFSLFAPTSAYYKDDDVDEAWDVWQAATEQSQKEIEILLNQQERLIALVDEKDARIAELEARLNVDFPLLVKLFDNIDELKAREKVLVDLAKLTYGYLWHINAGLDAPAILNVTSITPEKCSHIVRKLWLDVLTKEQRGEGINKAREALANVNNEKKG